MIRVVAAICSTLIIWLQETLPECTTEICTRGRWSERRAGILSKTRNRAGRPQRSRWPRSVSVRLAPGTCGQVHVRSEAWHQDRQDADSVRLTTPVANSTAFPARELSGRLAFSCSANKYLPGSARDLRRETPSAFSDSSLRSAKPQCRLIFATSVRNWKRKPTMRCTSRAICFSVRKLLRAKNLPK